MVALEKHRVELGAALQQHVHHVKRVVPNGHGQGVRPHLLIPRVAAAEAGVGASGHELLDAAGVPVRDRQHERRGRARGAKVHQRAVVGEDLEHVGVLGRHGKVQRRVSILTLRVHVGAGTHQARCEGGALLGRRQLVVRDGHERREAVFAPGGSVAPRGKQHVHQAQVLRRELEDVAEEGRRRCAVVHAHIEELLHDVHGQVDALADVGLGARAPQLKVHGARLVDRKIEPAGGEDDAGALGEGHVLVLVFLDEIHLHGHVGVVPFPHALDGLGRVVLGQQTGRERDVAPIQRQDQRVRRHGGDGGGLSVLGHAVGVDVVCARCLGVFRGINEHRELGCIQGGLCNGMEHISEHRQLSRGRGAHGGRMLS